MSEEAVAVNEVEEVDAPAVEANEDSAPVEATD
jgi:hypothetical protein